MNIIEILTENGIHYGMSGNKPIIQCPICKKEEMHGQPILSFMIDQNTGRGECGECQITVGQETWIEKLGITKSGIDKTMKSVKKYSPVKQNLTDSEQKIESILNSLDEKYESSLEFKRLGDVMSRDFGPIDWIVNGLIPAESFSVISGDPGNYKTWLTMDIAIRVSQGLPFLEHFGTAQSPVLIVDEENPERVVQSRLRLLGIEKTTDLPIHYLNKSEFDITNLKHLVRLMNYIIEHKIKLVIFDSLVRIHRGEENSAKDMSAMYRKISAITKLGVSVLATHHHRKGSEKSDSPQNLRGSSDIGAGLDAHLIVFCEKEEGMLYISQAKLRSDEPGKPFVIKIVKLDDKKIKFEYVGEDNRKQKKEEIMQNQVMEIFQNNPIEMTIKDVFEKSAKGSSENMLRTVLKNLDGNGLKSRKRKSGQLFYSLQTTEPATSQPT